MILCEPPVAAGLLLVENDSLIARQVSLLDQLQQSDRNRVLSHGHRHRLEKNQRLFVQGDRHEGIVVVESGRIRSFYVAPSGREITLAYWFPGNFVGGPDIFGGGVHLWSAEAVLNTDVLVLPADGLRTLAREVPDLALGLLDALAFKARCYSALAQMLGTRSMTERLAQLLLHLSATYGTDYTEGRLIDAAFTHADLAHLIGATRQWVTIRLGRLQKLGALKQNRGMIIIRRADLLLDAGEKLATQAPHANTRRLAAKSAGRPASIPSS